VSVPGSLGCAAGPGPGPGPGRDGDRAPEGRPGGNALLGVGRSFRGLRGGWSVEPRSNMAGVAQRARWRHAVVGYRSLLCSVGEVTARRSRGRILASEHTGCGASHGVGGQKKYVVEYSFRGTTKRVELKQVMGLNSFKMISPKVGSSVPLPVQSAVREGRIRHR
jgi:hypothetical protein